MQREIVALMKKSFQRENSDMDWVTYGFSTKLLPAGSSRMKVKDEFPVAHSFNFSINWSIASAVCGSTFWEMPTYESETTRKEN